LETKLVNSSERIAELESELQFHGALKARNDFLKKCSGLQSQKLQEELCVAKAVITELQEDVKEAVQLEMRAVDKAGALVSETDELKKQLETALSENEKLKKDNAMSTALVNAEKRRNDTLVSANAFLEDENQRLHQQLQEEQTRVRTQ